LPHGITDTHLRQLDDDLLELLEARPSGHHLHRQLGART
jgi:hypothetical protein